MCHSSFINLSCVKKYMLMQKIRGVLFFYIFRVKQNQNFLFKIVRE